MSICPYCARPVSSSSGREQCPHCEQPVFSVPCPKCGRRTLNLTQIPRYGRATCFGCQTVVTELPHTHNAHVIREPEREAPAPIKHPTVTPRSSKAPIMPSAEDARSVVEKCLVGLERAAQDREMLRAPDLRAIVTRFLDNMQALLELDTAMKNGEVTEEWLRTPEHLDAVARLCYAPLWPNEGTLLSPSAQAWVLAVDDAARRWQYARRRWLADEVGLTLMPTVPAITTTNPAWHEVDGDGPVLTEVLQSGFLLHGEVLRKATVRA